jgi:hypothetical protein
MCRRSDMPLQISLLKKSINQAKEMDTAAAVNELTESEKRRILGVLTEAVDAFASLRDRLRSEIASDVSEEAAAEERFKQRLLEKGLLKEIKRPPYEAKGDRTPIKVKGKPLSEMIIEERR